MVDRWHTAHGGISRAEHDKRKRLRAELEQLTRSPLPEAVRHEIAVRVRKGKVSQTFFRRGAALMGDG